MVHAWCQSWAPHALQRHPFTKTIRPCMLHHALSTLGCTPLFPRGKQFRIFTPNLRVPRLTRRVIRFLIGRVSRPRLGHKTPPHFRSRSTSCFRPLAVPSISRLPSSYCHSLLSSHAAQPSPNLITKRCMGPTLGHQPAEKRCAKINHIRPSTRLIVTIP